MLRCLIWIAHDSVTSLHFFALLSEFVFEKTCEDILMVPVTFCVWTLWLSFTDEAHTS